MSGNNSTDGGEKGAAASLIVAGAAGRHPGSSLDDDVGVRPRGWFAVLFLISRLTKAMTS